MNSNIVTDLKSFNWQIITNFGATLADLNDAQLRFAKGLAVELAVEKHSNNHLIYVGEEHKDFDWNGKSDTVELKSQLSASMYTKKGKLRKNYTIKLNNSNGTNTKKVLDPAHVADVLLVVRNDGSFAIDRDTVLTYAKSQGDGFVVKIDSDIITEISGPVTVTNVKPSSVKAAIYNAIRTAIP
jgi:hypothetical protein